MAIGDPKEVQAARREVRAKEAAVWNDRESAGRAARMGEAQEQGARQVSGGTEDKGGKEQARRQTMGS